ANPAASDLMKTSRRNFLATSFAAALAPVSEGLSVSEPYPRVRSRLIPGLAAYSFRSHFAWMKGKENRNLKDGMRKLDMPGFIRYCAEIGAEGAELTSYFFPPEADDAHFAHCREVAHVNGVAVSGTAVGNNFSFPRSATERAEQMDYVKSWIDRSVVMGAPHVRVFAGKHPEGISPDEAEENAIEALKEAGEYAGDRGIFLGIENHDSITTADRLLRIITAVDNPFVGVNLDSGNFIADDVYAEMEATAPYAVNVQIKTEIKVPDSKEKKSADLPRVFSILRNSGYAGHVVLEFEEKTDPFEHVPPLIEKFQEWAKG
ncbi:MAG: sugar phosphate isomerase/epimerase family protein, partial [Verrucomicrobiota bacterium]